MTQQEFNAKNFALKSEHGNYGLVDLVVIKETAKAFLIVGNLNSRYRRERSIYQSAWIPKSAIIYGDRFISLNAWGLRVVKFKDEEPIRNRPLAKQLSGWDGYSARGSAIYDQIFEEEKREGDRQDKLSGWYEEGGMYYGI